MSRNSKNHRLQVQEEALPKNRSAAARQRRLDGKAAKPGRATNPKHSKKAAWWQKFPSYHAWIISLNGKPKE